MLSPHCSHRTKPRKTRSRKLLLFLFLLTAETFFPGRIFTGQELTGTEIMTLEAERPDGDDRRSTMTMTLINSRGGQKSRTVETFSKDYGKDKKSLMTFKYPADVRGTMFLTWEYDEPDRDDDRWLYLPALKKVRRISGTSKNDYFMGTDFTYDDMGDRSVHEDTHTLLGEESVMGHNCWKVEAIPVQSEDIFTRRIIWVSKEAKAIIQTEYFDKDGLVKIYRSLDIRQQEGIWVTFRSEMDNVARDHKTVMEISSIRHDNGLEDELFRVSTIQRGRI